MLLAAARFNMKIRHCFLVPGHTYDEGVSVHASFERAAKRKEIYDMKEWIEIIKSAKVNKPFYKVKIMKRDDVKNFQVLVEKQNCEFDTEGRKVP